jgi:hypothetical protein
MWKKIQRESSLKTFKNLQKGFQSEAQGVQLSKAEDCIQRASSDFKE